MNEPFRKVLYVGRSEEQRAVPGVAQIFDSFRITPAAMESTSPQAAAAPTH
jgi:hypothetical protein